MTAFCPNAQAVFGIPSDTSPMIQQTGDYFQMLDTASVASAGCMTPLDAGPTIRLEEAKVSVHPIPDL